MQLREAKEAGAHPPDAVGFKVHGPDAFMQAWRFVRALKPSTVDRRAAAVSCRLCSPGGAFLHSGGQRRKGAGKAASNSAGLNSPGDWLIRGEAACSRMPLSAP